MTETYIIQHTAIARSPAWYLAQSNLDKDTAIRVARDIALKFGGYVCVRTAGQGPVVFGTDPAELDRAISAGTNRDFPKETARRLGCCVQ